MKFNIVFNKYISNYKDVLFQLESILLEKKIEFKSYNIDSMENFGDFTITLGGDGTLLKAAKFYAKSSIPVLGINQGRLGFLAQADIENAKSIIETILNNEYYIEERLMLISNNNIALNDFVVKGCDQSRTSKLFLEIDGEIACNYIADGLIISTPTGSTAYGLSAGGPVLHPSLDMISIVPICPHTLNARPLIVPSTEKIMIKTGDKPLSVVNDGYNTNECLDKIKIETAPYKAKLAFLSKGQFYNVLKTKLHWGIPPQA